MDEIYGDRKTGKKFNAMILFTRDLWPAPDIDPSLLMTVSTLSIFIKFTVYLFAWPLCDFVTYYLWPQNSSASYTWHGQNFALTVGF